METPTITIDLTGSREDKRKFVTKKERRLWSMVGQTCASFANIENKLLTGTNACDSGIVNHQAD